MKTTINSTQTPVICIIGSKQDRSIIEQAQTWFNAQGMLVLSVINGADNTPDAIAGRKIELSDEVHVLVRDGCIDLTTRAQIHLAQRLGKPIQFIEGGVDWKLCHVRSVPPLHQPLPKRLEIGASISLDHAFKVTSGAVLLYGPDPDRPAASLVVGHCWPGLPFVPEVWYAEVIGQTVIEPISADRATLESYGLSIRWSLAMAGSATQTVVAALHRLGSVATQEELRAVIGFRRETVGVAVRALKNQRLIEKHNGRIRLTARGVQAALRQFDLDRIEDFDHSSHAFSAQDTEAFSAQDTEAFSAQDTEEPGSVMAGASATTTPSSAQPQFH